MTEPVGVDVHQHLWPEELLEELRLRSRPPYLRGWTLVTDGEPPYEVTPSHHDPDLRVTRDREAGIGLACVSLSAPLGLERLDVDDAAPLLEAWHAGAARLPGHFAAWASVHDVHPDVDDLRKRLADGLVGVQVPATAVVTPQGWEAVGDVLAAAETAGKPVLVHPGPVDPGPDVPGWWAPVVGYVAQLQAAWWAWHAVAGRTLFPDLTVVVAAGAGLAPLQHERLTARGGTTGPVDGRLFVDTSSYGPQGLDALVRVLGVDALVLGSDAPYAEPFLMRDGDCLGPAARRRVTVDNPRRALGLGPATEEPSP